MIKALRWSSVIGFTGAAVFFWQRGEWQIALTSIILPLLVGLVPLLFQKEVSERGKKDSRLKLIFSGRDFKKQYFTKLRYKNRDFDIKGLSTHTEHTLELDQVFVELKLQTQAAHRTTSDPLQNVPAKLRGDSYPIWRFFSLLSENEKNLNPKLAIVGPPGSGKTTLLRHIVLLLSLNSKIPELKGLNFYKIPILFYLRDYIKEIAENSSVMLPELAESEAAKMDLPITPNWFSNQLRNGGCLVLFDGLDEVADLTVRRKVVQWLDNQIHTYAKNAFILTSRPHGYRENPITGVSVLEVMPFNRTQIDSFIQKWYLANEAKSHLGVDPGVRMTAKSGADDLIRRLEKTPTLMELAVNPLLLTMIATVHRYRSALPGRRVELYKEICEVFLGKRQESKGLMIDLVPAQKQSVLQTLAYEMMSGNIREVRTTDAAAIIRPALAMVAPNINSEVFLKSVEQQSGLLLERELGVYSFAHKTFQEYLASVYVLDNNIENQLHNHITDDWWHEVIRLYSAQTDATSIIKTCLNQDPPSATALSLAIQCLEEARQVQPQLRDIAEKILLEFAEDADLDIRKIIAEALLSNRIKHLLALSPSVFIDTKPLTNTEYQVFVDDMLWRGRGNFYPAQWEEKTFPRGSAHLPVTGLTPKDALTFTEWLTELYAGSGEWYFRLPHNDEVPADQYEKFSGFWIQEGEKPPLEYQSTLVRLWKNPKLPWPTVSNEYIRKSTYEEIKFVISILRSENKNHPSLGEDYYLQLISSLKNLLRASTDSDKLLVETADILNKKICQLSYERPVDFGHLRAPKDSYDQAVSDLIERFNNSDFEASILNGLKCFSFLLASDPRNVNHRIQHLFAAFAFEFINLWIDKNLPILIKNRADSIRTKIDYLVDQYSDDLIVQARRLGITSPFEGIIFVKEVKEGRLDIY